MPPPTPVFGAVPKTSANSPTEGGQWLSVSSGGHGLFLFILFSVEVVRIE